MEEPLPPPSKKKRTEKLEDVDTTNKTKKNEICEKKAKACGCGYILKDGDDDDED